MRSRIKLPDDFTEMDAKAMMLDGGGNLMTSVDEYDEFITDEEGNPVGPPMGVSRNRICPLVSFGAYKKVEPEPVYAQEDQSSVSSGQVRRAEMRTTLGCIGGGAFIIGAVVGLTLLFDD